MRPALIIFISVICIPLLICGAFPPDKAIEKALATITSDDLLKTVTFLCSKELNGRLSGSEGYNKAAEYISGKFRELKLKPYKDDSYYQEFNCEYNEISAPCKLVLTGGKEKNETFSLGKDFVCRGFTGSGAISAPVVFCGYGLSRPDIGYNDYAGVNVKGKIVILFKQNPVWKITGIDWGESTPRSKTQTALDHGASGVMFVSCPNNEKPQKPIGSVMEGTGKQLENIPMIHADIPVADKFLALTGYTLSRLQYKIDSLQVPGPWSVRPQPTWKFMQNIQKSGRQ